MGGNLSVATAAVADSTTREKRSSGLAIIGIAFGLGFIVGPAIGGLFAKINLVEIFPSLANYGVNPFSTPALVSFLLALINLIWVARRFKETLPEEKRGKVAPERKGLPVLRMFQNASPAIRRTNLVYLIYMLAFSGMEFTLTFLAVERFAFTPAQNGGMFVDSRPRWVKSASPWLVWRVPSPRFSLWQWQSIWDSSSERSRSWLFQLDWPPQL